MKKRRQSLPDTLPLNSQPALFIEHTLDGEVVPQRPRDGYINATRLCQQGGKKFNDYNRLDHTQAFVQELSLETGIPVSNLVQVIRGRGDRIDQGTWVHPQVAINLGQWLSPKFAVLVSKWVFDWMSGNVQGYMPAHVQRYLKNRAKIPPAYFSMLNEMYLSVLAPLENEGVIPPDNIMPDISTGKMFSNFLRGKGIRPEDFPTYEHEFVDGSRPTVYARLCPIKHLEEFRVYLHKTWLPQRAAQYFKERFPEALPHLPAMLQLPEP